MAIDLHTHSFVSDGEFSPEEVVAMAHKKGLSAVAVCDHDSLEGARRALKAGVELGILVVPAVEISTSYRGKVLHLLAYSIDLENKQLEEKLIDIARYRKERAVSIVENINKELVLEKKPLLEVEPILALGAEKPITRADIAQYLVDKGYVANRNEAFVKWLDRFNIPNKDLELKDAIALVHGARGVAVLAHPNGRTLSLRMLSEDLEQHALFIEEMASWGLDGVEVYRYNQSQEDENWYCALTVRLGLLATGGSDFHGPSHLLAAPSVGENKVDDFVLVELERVATKRAV